MSTQGPERPEPLPELGPELIRYSVAAAAQRLGISERAVRKRIQAGSLSAEPNGRTYWVYLMSTSGPGPEGPEPGPVPLDRNGPEPGPETRTNSAQVSVADQQLATLREGPVAPLVALTEQLTTVVAEQAETIGRLSAERDALQGRVRALEAQQVNHPRRPPAPRRRPQTRPGSHVSDDGGCVYLESMSDGASMVRGGWSRLVSGAADRECAILGVSALSGARPRHQGSRPFLVAALEATVTGDPLPAVVQRLHGDASGNDRACWRGQ